MTVSDPGVYLFGRLLLAGAVLAAFPAAAQPAIAVSPSSLAQSLAPGATASQTLTVSNPGTAPLTFTPDRAAATSPAGGPDAYGYTWSDSDRPGGPVPNWVDIRATGTRLPLNCCLDVGVDLPFAFPFYGETYTRVRVYADGFLSFLTTYQGITSNNRPIPYWDSPDLFIAGFWDDLDPERGEGVYAGTDARGRFVVQYQEIPLAGTPTPPGRFTFQIIIDPSGTIVIQYGPMTGATTSATVGIENATSVHGGSTTGLQVAYNQPYVRDGLAVRIARGEPWLAVTGGGTVEPGESTEVTASFSSFDLLAGTLESQLVFTSNDAATPTLAIPAALTVVSAPDVTVSATELDFDTVYVGAAESDTVLVSNAGSAPLTIASVTTDGAPFTATLMGSSMLAPGEIRQVVATFEPAVAGPVGGTLTVATDDPDEPAVAISLAGMGLGAPIIAITPDSILAVLETGQTVTRTLTIANGGVSDLEAEITFRSPAGGGLDSLYYDFGTGTAGTTGWTPWMPFAVANRFTADGRFHLTDIRAFLHIEQDPTVRFEVYGAGSFGDPTSGPLLWARDVVVPHGDAAMHQVPLDTTLVFEDGEDFYIAVWTQAEFAPFGTHHSNGGRSYRRTYHSPTWHFETGSATYVIRAVQTLAAALDAEPSAGIVGPGGSLEVTVTLDATHLPGGEHTADLVVESNDPAAPQIVVPITLEVTGVPSIVLTSDSLDFGEVYLGATRTRSLRVRNLGTAPLTISGVASSNPAFTYSPAAPFTVGVGASDTLLVTFQPTVAGPYDGVLTVNSDDPDTPAATVVLLGEGVDFPSIAVAPDSIAVALVAGDSTSVAFTISNAGPGPLTYVLEGLTGHPAAGAPDTFGYTWTDSAHPGGPTFRWVDISSSGTALALEDDTWEDVELPFLFPFYGEDKAAVRIASNGYLTFGSQRGDVWDARPIPHNWPPNDFIAPYWTDLDPAAGGTVYYGTDDAGRFVVQYDSVTTHSVPTWRSTFQVILEPAGTIVFQYLRRTAPFSGTVGIENETATDGLQITHNQFPSFVRDSLAVRIDPPTPWLSVSPSAGIVAPDQSAEVTLSLDANTLEQGMYLSALRVMTNDPMRPFVRVPVRLEVSGMLRIALTAGWNLVSWNVQPVDVSVERVLSAVLDRVQVVETYEGGQRRWFVPGQAGNTLTQLMATYGYWIKVTDDATLEIEGTPVDPQLGLPLTEGINAVSYLPWRSNTVGYALESVMAVTRTAATFQGTGVTYAPSVSADFHVLDRMEPKAGYLVRTVAPGTLVYPTLPAGHPTGTESRPTLEGRLEAETVAGVTPTMAWLDAWGADIRLPDDTLLPVGTHVVALDTQGRPVGAFDVVAEGRIGLMPIYADDPYTPQKDGALQGEPISLRVRDLDLAAALTWTAPGDVVDLSHIIVADEGGPDSLPTAFALEANSPNPFGGSTTIRYALPEATRVRLVVYDVLGRVVATLVDGEVAAGRHAVAWDAAGAASGAYVAALEAEDFRASRRMMLAR